MNIDPQLPQLQLATATPQRPGQPPPEQTTSRPVEQPRQAEATSGKPADPSANRHIQDEKNREQHAARGRGVRNESELSDGEKRELDKLKARDREAAARATRMEAEARQKPIEEQAAERDVPPTQNSTKRSVGALLDVFA